MLDVAKKHISTSDGGTTTTLVSDLKNLSSVLKPRRTMLFAYGFTFAFVIFTAFIAFNPSSKFSSPWFNNVFSSSSSSTSDSTFRSQVPSFLTYFFPNSSQPTLPFHSNFTKSINGSSSSSNLTDVRSSSSKPKLNLTLISPSPSPSPPPPPPSVVKQSNVSTNSSSSSSSPLIGSVNSVNNTSKKENSKKTVEGLLNSLMNCDLFNGKWVKDDSYPLYQPGSCPHIDESFKCLLNGRPDKDYQKLRWKPNDCDLPRLNGRDMLELLRGKRLVFVGDSLNRNMWESLICILRNSLKDKSKVFEASGRREFRTEGFYSFIFKDYNCSIEFFRSPFLVQEWEMPDTNGTTKETLRLDLVERSSSKYKDADIIVFNTGHWWTHDKTSKGKDYYQVGNKVFGSLNVVEAFHKALLTWAKWVDVNINPHKTLVLFRGYSASHFSGGQWNSGGACDSETEPIKNETYLSAYPPKMRVLESVLSEMKTPVTYLNITRMTDYRKDGHPSIYRKKNLPDEERKSPLRYQDCSHWCLPGVPDLWNEILYAEILIKHNLQQQQQQLRKEQEQGKQQKQKQP